MMVTVVMFVNYQQICLLLALVVGTNETVRLRVIEAGWPG